MPKYLSNATLGAAASKKAHMGPLSHALAISAITVP